MADKKYLRIEQNEGSYSPLSAGPEVCLRLEPEEDAPAQVEGYKKFLAEVDAGVISRSNLGEMPQELTQKEAYCIAFHLDLGWGERFVTSFARSVKSIAKQNAERFED